MELAEEDPRTLRDAASSGVSGRSLHLTVPCGNICFKALQRQAVCLLHFIRAGLTVLFPFNNYNLPL